MRKYSKGELKHLKFKLIKFEGLSVSQADKRINELIKFEKKLDLRKKAENIKNKKNSKETLKKKLDDDIKRLRKL